MISVDLQGVQSDYINWQALVEKALLGERISIRKAGREVANINPVNESSPVGSISLTPDISNIKDEQITSIIAPKSKIEETFGMFTSKKGVTVDEMDEAVRRRGAGL